MNNPNPIGANCEIRYFDEVITHNYYFSFVGQTEDDGEEHEEDRAGVPDTDIFYFADDGEDEIKQLMKVPSTGCQNDFIILTYELAYGELK